MPKGNNTKQAHKVWVSGGEFRSAFVGLKPVKLLAPPSAWTDIIDGLIENVDGECYVANHHLVDFEKMAVSKLEDLT